MPNPKGNPHNLKPFTTDRDEPLSERLNIRITKSMLEKLNQLGDKKAEFCREAIEKALEESEKLDNNS
jgi:predicted DNA-binding protein